MMRLGCPLFGAWGGGELIRTGQKLQSLGILVPLAKLPMQTPTAPFDRNGLVCVHSVSLSKSFGPLGSARLAWPS